jgi:hypothetical protein
MKMLLKILAGIVAVVVVAVVGLLITARMNDGPMEIVAGGAFTTGTLQTGPEPDWRFVHDVQEVQFQLLDPERSRTTWIVEVNGRIYIPSGYMNTPWGKLWKQWPIEAEKDGRILLRVDGQIYKRQLVRVMSSADLGAVVSELGRKYMGGLGSDSTDEVTSGNLWIFELVAADF